MFPNGMNSEQHKKNGEQFITAFDIVHNFGMQRVNNKKQADEKAEPIALRNKPFSQN
jgi:hypothetical protein